MCNKKSVKDERFRLLFENSLDAMILADDHGRYLDVNQAACDLFGYSREQMLSMRVADLITVLAPNAQEQYQKYLQAGRETGEFSFVHANGTTRITSYSACCLLPGQHLSILRDITERSTAERQQRFLAQATELLTSSLDYQTTLHSVAQLVVPHLADWCIVHLLTETHTLEMVTAAHVDPAKVEMAWEFSRRYPHRMDEAGGPAQVARSGKSQWVEEIMQASLCATAQNEEHYRMLLAAGMKSYLCVPLVSRGKPLGTITFLGAESGHRYTADSLPLAEELARHAAIAVDNARLFQQAQQEIATRKRIQTERERQQDALRESERRYRFMAEAIPQIVWIARSDGRLDYSNQRWVDYTGLTAEQTTDKGWDVCIHREDLQSTLNVWREAARTSSLYSIEHRIRSKNGEYRWFLTRAVALRDAEGQILQWFGTATDIEDQKRAQERERLLGQLGEQMRSSADPQEILWTTVSAIGEYLHVSRCYYAKTDVDAGKTEIYRDYCRGVESWAGTYSLNSFGEDVLADLNRGLTVAIADTKTDPRTAAYYEATYIPVSIRAYLAVPLMENGRRIASLVVSISGAPRCWTGEEITLLETAAERTRLAVKNARLWKAERERTDQLTRAVQEVHHRVKNSLQSVSALLEMQIPVDSDMLPISTVRESLNQIKTIALVHDLLARDQPIGNVDAAQVLTKLAALLSAGMRTLQGSAPIHVRVQSVWIPTKAATSLALAVNELISNAAKHNPKSTQSNQEDSACQKAIEVRLTKHDGEVHVTVEDSGPGFPANFDPRLHANIGLELVLTLVHHDLQGSITFSNRVLPHVIGRSCGGRVEIIFLEDVLSE